LLQEWNDVDRHTLPVTGDLVEDWLAPLASLQGSAKQE
jgi:hypothetical protein